MARTFLIPVQNRTAGVYGPFPVDGRRLGDLGVRINVTRGANGVWPLSPADPILTVLLEYQYGTAWSAAAQVTFNGGTQIDRWTGTTKLVDSMTVEWPHENVGGVLTLMKPDAARATFIVHASADIGGSVQWM